MRSARPRAPSDARHVEWQVLALDARFFSSVEFVTFGDAHAVEASRGGMLIQVHSPQFRDERRYVYKWGSSATEASLELAPPRTEGEVVPSPNKYVEVPLLYCLTLLRYRHGGSGGAFFEEAVGRASTAGPLVEEMPPGAAATVVGLRITLCADNGFYSQAAELSARGLPQSAASLRALPPYLPPNTEGGDLAKTGLGSSATLVTSLLGAMLHAFGAIELPGRCASDDEKPPPGHALAARGDAALELLHALAQLCHCAAQGKVGSGFDVCVAVYGSQRYTRFSPSLIAPLLALAHGVPPPADALLSCVGGGGRASGGWDHVVEPFQLPPGIEVLMGDVSAGANTPSMVKKIIQWRKTSEAAGALWREYAIASDALQAGLRRLRELHGKLRKNASKVDKLRSPSPTPDSARQDAEWFRSLTRCGNASPSEWKTMGLVGAALAALCEACTDLRVLIREISAQADVPIEPPEQTALLDATMGVKGVVMAVVPGAGGNDAVIALVIPTDDSVLSAGGGGGGGRFGAPPPSSLTAGARAAVAEMWLTWPQVAPPPKPSVVCELIVTESRATDVGRNGVMVEGEEELRALSAAREAHTEQATPTTPLGRRLLRIFTQTELEAQARAVVRREVLLLGALVAIAAIGGRWMLLRRR